MLQRKMICAAVVMLFALSALAADRSNSEKVTSTAKNTPTPPAMQSVPTGDNVSPVQPTSVAVPNAGEQIKWQVISGGGNRGTSASYVLSGTVGQMAVGLGTSASYKINQGFWQNFAPTSCCTGTTGNVNMAGIVDLSDLSALVSYLTGGGYVLTCIPEANINSAGIVDLSDLSALVSYLTGGGYVLPNCQ